MAVQDGDEKNGCFLSGQIAGMVTKKETCSEIISSLISGAEEIIGGLEIWVK